MDRLRVSGKGSDARTYESLTDRELETLQLAAQGMSNKEIADKLNVSVHTVEAHLGRIFNKLDVGSRTEAVMFALKKGWISLA
jgi:DNA-binding NarL/FixJ family response regulator